MSVQKQIFLLFLVCNTIDLTHELCRDMYPQYQYARTSSTFDPASVWDTHIVTVSFFNGDCHQRSMVRMAASEWTPYSNIYFIFIDDPFKADIRVGFYENLKGSWSFIGMHSKDNSVDVKTGVEDNGKRGVSMNFAWRDRSTILHEFGHALGLKHEHQNPYGGIKWNRTALTEYYGKPPNSWDDEMIDSNVIIPVLRNQTNGVYDPDSIMHYSIEPELTMNRCCGTKENYDLSKGDKLAIQKLYKKLKPSRDAAKWSLQWNGIGNSNNRAHRYEKSWKGTGLSHTQKNALIAKILCQPANEVYAGLLSRPTPKVSAYGTCMVGIVREMPTFWVQGMYGAHGHSGYPKNPDSKDATGHLRNCYKEHKLTGLCSYSNVAERAKQTLLYAIENDVCTDFPNL